MAKISRILYPTDFSPMSLHALDYALELCERCQAELHCMHVVDDSYQYWLSFDAATVPAGPPLEQLMTVAKEEMAKFVAEHLAGRSAKTCVMHGRAFLEIIRYARDNQIDLIVMGTHGRSALRQVLVGSVANKVIHKSPCPVLSVRDPKHNFQMP